MHEEQPCRDQAVADALAGAGLDVRAEPGESGAPEYLVFGNTYAYKELLKRHGGRWSQRRQAWVFSSLQRLQHLATALPPGGSAGAPGLADAPGEYEEPRPRVRHRPPRSTYMGRKRGVRGHWERLRARFLEGGPASLPDYELLELLLTHSVEFADTKQLAKDLLEHAHKRLGLVLALEPMLLRQLRELSFSEETLVFARYRYGDGYLADRRQGSPAFWSEDGKRWLAYELTGAGRTALGVLTGGEIAPAGDDRSWLDLTAQGDGRRLWQLAASGPAAWEDEDWRWLADFERRAEGLAPGAARAVRQVLLGGGKLWRAYDETEAGRADVDRYWAWRKTDVLFKLTREVGQRALREEIAERPVIGSWSALLDYLQAALANEPIEQFRVLFLDRKNILMRDEVQQRGTVDHTPLYPREIVKRALEIGASAIIMVHNHPSGDPTPSRADIQMTKQVAAALDAVGITLHDHVVVGKKRHVSFKSQNLL